MHQHGLDSSNISPKSQIDINKQFSFNQGFIDSCDFLNNKNPDYFYTRTPKSKINIINF